MVKKQNSNKFELNRKNKRKFNTIKHKEEKKSFGLN
jgi:hypothetical protein